VIHGDFTPWNLLFDGGRLTGVLDFEATHHTFQVADFALSWRGYHDDVLSGYDEVRTEADPRAAVLAFYESAYQAGARRAGWQIEPLACPGGVTDPQLWLRRPRPSSG
jgi:aminoglycoside phosphotransferase (APT) family kinase protein